MLIRTLSAGAIVLLLSVSQSIGLLQVVKGDRWITTSRQDFRLPGSGESEEGFTYRTEVTVLEKTESGWRAESKTEMMESRSGGVILPPAKGTTPLIEKVMLGSNGERASFGGRLANPIEFRIDRLTWFVGIGAAKGKEAGSVNEWSISLPGDEGGAVPKANVRFHLGPLGEYKTRKARWASARLAEEEIAHPITAIATFVLDNQTGLLLSAKIEARNVPIPGGTGQHYDLTIDNDVELKLNPHR